MAPPLVCARTVWNGAYILDWFAKRTGPFASRPSRAILATRQQHSTISLWVGSVFGVTSAILRLSLLQLASGLWLIALTITSNLFELKAPVFDECPHACDGRSTEQCPCMKVPSVSVALANGGDTQKTCFYPTTKMMGHADAYTIQQPQRNIAVGLFGHRTCRARRHEVWTPSERAHGDIQEADHGHNRAA